MKKNHHIIHLLLLINFFIYAVSPLSYTCELRQDADNKAISSPRLLIVELLLSKINKQKSQDAEAPSGRCLLKKKRAVISSNKPTLSKNTIEKVCLIPDDLLFAQLPSLAVENLDSEPNRHRGFSASHSGLSPPLA